ncbi:creatinase-like [Hydractinia symbiolongicarpus]|uniref:creatinase-like n=1 Tax=Hydractinia symbiolongicarpus TaxID=13093 RepID=UPI0025518506|nr:creatinase-like [Hydractinia symbiolongicarpus]
MFSKFRLITPVLQYAKRSSIANVTSSASILADFPALEDCRQGEKTGGVFSKNEMERRLAKLRDTMVGNNIDVCVFTSHHNIAYYSEFLYFALGRPYGLVVTMDNQTSISAKVDYGQPWRKTYGDNITYTDWQRDNYYKAVQQLVGDKKRIGLEFDHVTLQNMDKFKAALPDASFFDVGVPTMGLRIIKSDEEIALTKNGARIADMGGLVVKEAIRENVAEYEVAQAATNVMIKEIAAAYPQTDLMDTWTWVQSGINTDAAHNPLTTRKIKNGDIIIMNCFPLIAGYFSALERTMFLQHATDKQLEYWEINCKVHRRGCEIIKPGVKCKDVANELNEIFREHDLVKNRTFGYGHSFGLICHYYGREAGLELREDIETVLEPNMILSMEPMIVIPEGQEGAGGYREHDILVVTEDGAEIITKFPFGPEHNIIKN